MPELPEVETIRRGLEQGIISQVITDVEVRWENSFPVPAAIRQAFVVGAKVCKLERRAKVLIIHLDNQYSLLFHLKMTGQVVMQKRSGERFVGGHPTESMRAELPDRSSRVVFGFESGDKLFFNDSRKFGWIKLVETSLIEDDSLIRRLGPEPLSEAFNIEGFQHQLLRHKRAPIKPTILDQSTVSGIGNIYADESLHLAKIHPARLSGELETEEVSRLHMAIRVILALGIEHGGTSFTSYVNALGGKGDYLQFARVFRRQGTPCLVCYAEIKKIRLAGRGTHFCPQCQVAP